MKIITEHILINGVFISSTILAFLYWINLLIYEKKMKENYPFITQNIINPIFFLSLYIIFNAVFLGIDILMLHDIFLYIFYKKIGYPELIITFLAISILRIYALYYYVIYLKKFNEKPHQ